MGSISPKIWLISLGIHIVLAFIFVLNLQESSVDFKPLQLNMNFNSPSLLSSAANPLSQASLAPESVLEDLWEIDPLDSVEYSEMGWEEITPARRVLNTDPLKNLGLENPVSSMDLWIPEMDSVLILEDSLSEELPQAEGTLEWGIADLQGTGEGLPDISHLPIFNPIDINVSFEIDPSGVVLNILGLQETESLELNLLITQFLRSLSFPAHPEGIAYTQSLTIAIRFKEDW